MDTNCANAINRINYNLCKKYPYPSDKTYDIIVAGGGIAALNTIYQLLKTKPSLNIILFEKNDVLGGRLKRGYLGKQPVDLGAIRIPTDFVLTPNLVKELGLTLIPFTTALKGTYTREKWFSISELNKSQTRYFLPSGTPAKLNQIELLEKTLQKLVGTLKFNELNPNKIINGVRLVDWGIYDLLRICLTEEEINWISNSLNFSFYKSDFNAYEWCIHNYHNPNFWMVGTENPNGPKFGNFFELIDKLDKKTQSVNKYKNYEVKSAYYNYSQKIWEIKVLNLNTNKYINCYSKIFLSGIPNFNLRNLIINIPDQKKWDYLMNCNVPFPLSRIYVEYPYKWWSAKSGSYFDESTNKMIWIMSDTSPVILGSYSDEYQSNYWAGLPDEKILDTIHRGICRALNVKYDSVPKPLRYIKKLWTNPTYPVYWYKRGINGTDIQKMAVKPFNDMPFYIASETLSKRVGWVEGALHSSYAVVSKILSEI